MLQLDIETGNLKMFVSFLTSCYSGLNISLQRCFALLCVFYIFLVWQDDMKVPCVLNFMTDIICYHRSISEQSLSRFLFMYLFWDFIVVKCQLGMHFNLSENWISAPIASILVLYGVYVLLSSPTFTGSCQITTRSSLSPASYFVMDVVFIIEDTKMILHLVFAGI